MPNYNEFKRLLQLPLVIVGTKLTWNNLTKQEKDERLSAMWVAIVMTDNPLLAKGMENIYDWCVKNYE
jgi:hypothetical protein